MISLSHLDKLDPTTTTTTTTQSPNNLVTSLHEIILLSDFHFQGVITVGFAVVLRCIFPGYVHFAPSMLSTQPSTPVLEIVKRGERARSSKTVLRARGPQLMNIQCLVLTYCEAKCSKVQIYQKVFQNPSEEFCGIHLTFVGKITSLMFNCCGYQP